jgi:hypothetical protein
MDNLGPIVMDFNRENKKSENVRDQGEFDYESQNNRGTCTPLSKTESLHKLTPQVGGQRANTTETARLIYFSFA